MAEQPETCRTPEGFDSRSDFTHAVKSAFIDVIPKYSNGYPDHGDVFGSILLNCMFALLECPFDGAPSKYFNIPEYDKMKYYQYSIYNLAEFLSTLEYKGYDEDSDLGRIYELMKSLGVPIIEYRDRVGPIIKALDVDELEVWGEKQEAED